MNEFEQDLRDALSRRDPPEGFVERVLSRAGTGARGPHVVSGIGWVAAAAAALILTVGLVFDSGRIEQARGEQAKQEVLLALRVAGRTLNEVEQRVRQAQPLRIGRTEEN